MQVQQPAHFLPHTLPIAVQHSLLLQWSTWQRLIMDQQAIRDFVLEYVSELKDLTFNSKSLINTLTMLAGDTPEAASSIAAAIEKHILTVRLVSYHLSFTPLTALCVQAIRIQCSTEKLILSSHSPGLQCASKSQAVCPLFGGQHSQKHWRAVHHPLCREHARGTTQLQLPYMLLSQSHM